MTQQWECWAYVSPCGSIDVDPKSASELEVWNDYLGYITVDQIQAAKQRGARVIRVRIEEICDDV